MTRNKVWTKLFPFVLISCITLAAFADRADAQTAPVQFAFGGSVAQVNVEITDHLMLAPVSVNGSQPSWFLVDTMQPVSSIDDVRAVALKIYTPTAGNNAKQISNATLEVPGLKVTIPSLAFESFGDISSRIGHTVQGMLGRDVLSHFVVVLNYERQTLQIYDPKDFQYKGKGVQVPLQTTDGIPAIDARLSIPHRGTLHGEFALATALREPVEFSPNFATAHSLSAALGKTIPFSPAGAATETDAPDALGRIHNLQFGKITLDDPLAIVPGTPTPGNKSAANLAGELGGGILDRFTITLDYSHKTAWFEPDAHFYDLFTADMSGLSIVAIPPDFHAFEIAQVVANSPAAQAGIQVGDILEEIDGNPVTEFTLDEIRAQFRQDGVTHKIVVNRNGKNYELTLTLKPLV